MPRVGAMPIHRHASIIVSTAVLLAACGSPSSPSSGDSTPTGTVLPISPATASTSSTVGQPHGHASATDNEGDGGDADLLGVGLGGSTSGLNVTYKLSTEPATTGTTLLAIFVTTPNGDQSWQLGLKYIDGDANVFVFDMASGTQDNVDTTPQAQGGTVSVVFPAESVAPLGSSFKWRAVTNVDGTDVDSCPDEGDDMLNPVMASFPAA